MKDEIKLIEKIEESLNIKLPIYIARRVDTEEWVMGYVSRLHMDMKSKTPMYEFNVIHERGVTYQCYVIPETLCRRTGLTDKNGVWIWENDIVKNHMGITQVVIYENGSFQFIEPIDLVYGERQGDDFCACEKKYLDYEKGILADVVIGNIIDNPKWLKSYKEE